MTKLPANRLVSKPATRARRAATLTLAGPDTDAIDIGKLYAKGRAAIVESVRYLIEAGQKLSRKRDDLDHGQWLPWLKAHAGELGFGDRTARMLIKAAAKWKLTANLDEGTALEISREIWGNKTVRGTEGTGEFERYTPREYIEAVRDVLGEIDLDPASCEIAQRIVRASKYFTQSDDGLKHQWRGRVFLNPPYHRDLMPAFVDKLIAEVEAQHVEAAILLSNNCSDTQWFLAAQAACSAICFTMGRIQFGIPYGGDVLPMEGLPTQGQTFFYFGLDVPRFAAVFCHIGFGLVPGWQFQPAARDPIVEPERMP